MKKTDFLNQANELISDNPIDRVSDKVKEVLENEEAFIDSHLHIFDRKCVPIPYFRLRDKARKTFKNADAEEIINSNEKFDTDLLKFLRILGLSSSEKVLQYLYKKFYNINETIITPLMMDLEPGWQRKATKSIATQIKEMKALVPNYPILPFLAIDPRRVHHYDKKNKKIIDDLYTNFLEAFTGTSPFFGVKVYPATGFLPSDSRLLPIYEICEKKSIPVTTHCGGNIISTTINPVEYNGLDIETLEPYNSSISDTYKNKADFFNNPQNWLAVLKKYKQLKLNFGHFGGGTAWNDVVNSKRIKDIEAMMEEFNNVYGDISFNLTQNSFMNVLNMKMTNNNKVKERTLYGTDFHVVLASKDLGKDIKRYKEKFSQWKQISRINPEKFLFEQSYNPNLG